MKWARPERVQARLRQAATLKETFYGLLAASALGIEAPEFAGLHNYHDAEWRKIAREPNVQAAIGLVEIGEAALAEQFIKHQAKLGGREEHAALIHLAADLSLASAQYRSEEHTSELQSLMRISYAVFCLKKKKTN